MYKSPGVKGYGFIPFMILYHIHSDIVVNSNTMMVITDKG